MGSRIPFTALICTLFIFGSSWTTSATTNGAAEKAAGNQIYRFYFPYTDAYLTGSNSSSTVVAQERNPFSLKTEWEWISQAQYRGVLLKNTETLEYLCFDKQGKPVVQKQLNLDLCLLRGHLPQGTHVEPSFSERSLYHSAFVEAFLTTSFYSILVN
ncbi:hypothetical protein Aperf_G00000128464 [Anoplocephala perfoliata]